MKKIQHYIFSLAIITCLTGVFRLSAQSLETGFINPPDSIQTSVYWYWISDNVSKEGVVKDLQAMKAAGINRAFIGDIGLDDIPYGKIKMLSDEWWDILHAALKTATALNIEIGIFNSPGWSQSGGPWIKTNEAMRFLTSSSIRVKGPVKFSQKLEKPIEIFQDVKLIAYPAPENDEVKLDSSNCTISSFPSMSSLVNLIDGNKKTGLSFPKEKNLTFDFNAKKAFLSLL